MRTSAHSILFVTVGLISSACAIQHNIVEDYPQFLIQNAGRSNLPKTTGASEYILTPVTQLHRYEFRAVETGVSTLWIVEFGKMLDDQLMSAEVQQAFGTLKKVTVPSASSAGLLTFNLRKYSFEDLEAHVALDISLTRNGKEIFYKTYAQDGKTPGGKMFVGTVMAEKNAVQQSTQWALDEILRQLIVDLNKV